MFVYRDNFSSDSGWQAAAGHVDATKNISDGIMTLTVGDGSDHTSSLWTKTGVAGLDAIVVAKLSGAVDDPQIHMRETDNQNFLGAFIDTSAEQFIMADIAGGVTTNLASATIDNFNSSIDYTIAAKVFGDAFHAFLLDENDQVIIHLTEVSSTISDQAGTLHGVGTGGIVTYSQVDMRIVSEMTNILCLGDSNTDGFNIDFKDEFPQVINAERIFDNCVAKEAGKAGDNIAECEARIATEVAPFHVDGYRNVCIMQMGTNDRADGFTAAQSWTRYQSAIATAKAAGFEVFVGTGFPNTKADVDNTQWNEDLNASILADEATYGYTAVDIWLAYGGVEGSGFPPNIERDWVSTNNPHASEYGHRIFAGTYMDSVKRIRRRPLTQVRSAASTRQLITRNRISQPRLSVTI